MAYSDASSDDEIKRLHIKLLYTTLAIDHLYDSIDKGLQKDRFLAEAKPFLRTEIAQSYRSVQEIFQHLERSGDIKVGKYDVLKEIVKFNVKMLEEIEKTEMAMKTLRGPVTCESDNGCDKCYQQV